MEVRKLAVFCRKDYRMSPVTAKYRGYTLVELMIAVAIVSILSTLAIFGVRKYVNASKTVEARNSLGQISKDVGTAFLRETPTTAAVLTLGHTAARSNELCASGPAIPSGTVPRGQKYQSSPGEWVAGWGCLRFSMQDPQYYQYEYIRVGDGVTPNATSFQVVARGDLDADSTTSRFIYNGALISDGDTVLVVLGANISETNADD
jgi:type IV pilus assembly protein PilA